MTITSHILNEIDLLIQSGQSDKALDSINTLTISKIPRQLYSHFTRLCWRCGNAEMGLHLLNPLIKNPSAKLTPSEWLEYAMCLNSIGAVLEAQKIMKLESSTHELYDLYMAFSYIYMWDYENAIPLLQKTLSTLLPSNYFYYVTLINLLACYVAIEKFPEANDLYSKAKSDLPLKYKRLQANLSELYIQLLCGEKKTDQGLKFLNNYYSANDLSGFEKMYFLKWKTIFQVQADIISKDELLSIANTALQQSMWEVARDCETRYAFITRNPTFIKRVYFGTPWLKFRERIYLRFKDEVDFSKSFEMWLFPTDQAAEVQKSEPQISVDTEEGIIGSLNLKKGSLNHRLIRSLSTDFYRPHSLGGLFSNLFEGERFDISSSPNRIYRAVSELREHLRKEKIPLEIRQIGSGYKLNALEGIKFKIPTLLAAKKIDFKLTSLKTQFPSEFSAKDISEYLNVSLKTAQRILSEALEGGNIEKIKIKTTVRYRWK